MTSPPVFHPFAYDQDLRRRLLRLAGRWTMTGGDAEDLVQETYLRTSMGALPITGGHEAWMVTVLRNLCIDVSRRQDRYQAILACHGDHVMPRAHDEGPEQLTDQTERVEAALRHMLRSLPPGDAALLLLHDVFELDHAQLGELSGRSEAASRQHVRRLLQRVRRQAEPSNDDPLNEDTGEFFSLCRWAVTRRDPAGLIATLRVSRPMALAGMAAYELPMAQQTRSSAGALTRTQLVHIEGVLGLAIFSGDQQVAWLPLGNVIEEDCAAA